MRYALVVGSGPRVWHDVEKAGQLCRWDAVYVVNQAGIHWPGDEAFTWCSLHPHDLLDFLKQRQLQKRHGRYELVVPLEVKAPQELSCRRVAYRWRLIRSFTPTGSSGLFAVKVALDDGATHVVLAGVPMSHEPHFHATKPWLHRDVFIPGWRIAWPYYKDNTRSLSGGWTQDLLGAPTREWLDSLPPVNVREPIAPAAYDNSQRLHRWQAHQVINARFRIRYGR